MKFARNFLCRCALPAFLCLLPMAKAIAQQPAKSATSATDASADPLLQAMRQELDRSKAKLKLDNVPAPYYIEYRLSDVSEYDAEAAFGALREEQNFHGRTVRVVVRVGDYKQDSYYGPGVGVATFAPVDNNPVSLRWQLWTATDQAYKAASQALALKKAALSQFTPLPSRNRTLAPRCFRAVPPRFSSTRFSAIASKVIASVVTPKARPSPKK